MADSPPDSGSDESQPTSGADVPHHLSDAASSFQHRPVMLDEVVELIGPLPPGTFLDATLGGGSHAEAILAAHDQLSLVGVDRDPTALAAAADRLSRFGDRFTSYRTRFDQLDRVLDDQGTAQGGAGESGGPVAGLSGFLFDLGVSSPQLDRAGRGFSFRNDGPLDMRMDPDAPLSADDVVNTYDQRDLAELIRRNSDERFATRIAAAIVAARPVRTTNELAEIVVNAIPAPARRRGGHPAKRTFQAIRIEVNDELTILGPALDRVLDALVPGGRGIVITYHSGEDRITKDAFRRRTTDDRPRDIPIAPGGLPGPDYQIVRPMARRPTDAEVEDNPRAASARLRAIERIAA